MKLNTVHQVLIVGAIALGLIYALRGFVLFFRGQGGANLVYALLSTVVAVALGLYLKRFREKLRAASAEESERD